MAKARIYRPSKTAMQSGRAGTKKWVLEFEPQAAKRPDPLMGWAGSNDMSQQVKLRFSSREEAESYAKRYDIPYTVLSEHKRKPIFKTYADNFK